MRARLGDRLARLTLHGAFPKLTKGLRLNAVAYYRHQSVLPQENMTITMKDEPCTTARTRTSCASSLASTTSSPT